MYRDDLIGSVSSGTMRNEDLIPIFLRLAWGLVSEAGNKEQLDVLSAIRYRIGEGNDGAYYPSSDAANHDLVVLFYLLGEYAPDGCYFGAHPADGADYGFWPCEDEE